MGKVRVKEVAIDSTLVEAKKGEGIGIDGHKNGKGQKGRLRESGRASRNGAVGPGNAHDRRQLEEVLGGFRVKKGGRGRARTRPRVVGGDAADDAVAGDWGRPAEGSAEGEGALPSIGRPIGGLEAAWSGSSGG